MAAVDTSVIPSALRVSLHRLGIDTYFGQFSYKGVTGNPAKTGCRRATKCVVVKSEVHVIYCSQ